jgi:hypothetical protein
MLLKIRLILILSALVLVSSNTFAQKVLNLSSDNNTPLSINLVTGNFYLGWLNPDGAKQLSSEYEMIFEVTGNSSQNFTATGSFDWKDGNVFITGSTWFYDDKRTNGWNLMSNVSNYSFSNQPFQIKSGQVKKALFKLVPGTVFAAPNAQEGFYTFAVNLEVQDTSH